jgi:uncharacterized protein (TIGR03435 family)
MDRFRLSLQRGATMTRAIAIASLIGFMSEGAFTQSKSALPVFDVASVKPTQSGGPRGGVRVQTNSLIGENVTLRQLMTYAYEVAGYQLSGPDWIDTEGYDVAAMAKGSLSATQFRLMLWSLLEDRFKLKTHRETKEVPAYWLVVAKGGPKLRDVKEEQSFFSALAGKSPFKPGFMAIFSNKSLPEFAERLGRPMDRPVMDKTGIDGRFWFQLESAMEPGQTGQELYLRVSPPLFTALREQLGLNLEAAKPRSRSS